MTSRFDLLLTDELRQYIDTRVGDNREYATPSEYLRDLIRQDMAAQLTLRHIIDGLDDVKEGRFSKKSILDVLEED